MAQPSFHQIQNSCLNFAANYVGEEFVYKGVTYKGIISETKNERDIESGGYRNHTNMSIYVNKNGFPIPAMGDFISARGKQLFILAYNADSISYLLHVKDVD